jgi:hypothetical protein
MSLRVRSEAVRVLSIGTWSDGTEPADRQIRWGDAYSNRLVAWVSVYEPDGETRKLSIGPDIAPENYPEALSVVELEFTLTGQDKPLRGGGSVRKDKSRVVAFHQVAGVGEAVPTLTAVPATAKNARQAA